MNRSFVMILFFFKQETAYEMRISDWSSDVCSSDLAALWGPLDLQAEGELRLDQALRPEGQFDSRLKGAGEIIDRLTATGKLKPEAAFAARLGVAALGRPDTATGETGLSAPIRRSEEDT